MFVNLFAGKRLSMIAVLVTAACASLVGVAGVASANCDNYGNQVVVGDYSCTYQDCRQIAGAGAGAGAGANPGGENGVEAGASAGTSCEQSTDSPPPEQEILDRLFLALR